MIYFLLAVGFILLIPLKLNMYIHNKSIKVKLYILKFINITLIDKEDITKLEKKTEKKVKSTKIYNVLKNKIKFEKNYLKKINVFKLIKNIVSHFKIYIDLYLKFGFERRDITAVTYGFFEMFLPIVKTKIKEFNYVLLPNFSTPLIDFEIKCTIKTNLFKVIIIIFILLQEMLLIRKHKKED